MLPSSGIRHPNDLTSDCDPWCSVPEREKIRVQLRPEFSVIAGFWISGLEIAREEIVIEPEHEVLLGQDPGQMVPEMIEKILLPFLRICIGG